MKKLRITVNNKTYDVIVEVIEDTEKEYTGSNYMKDLPVKNESSGKIPRVENTQKTQNKEKGVYAPIVGTVTKIFIKEGDTVKKDSPILILDAMKMDTYINAPEDGKIKEIKCKVGENVSAGELLVTFE